MKAKYRVNAKVQIVAVVEEYEMDVTVVSESSYENAINAAKEKIHTKAKENFDGEFEQTKVIVQEVNITEIEK